MRRIIPISTALALALPLVALPQDEEPPEWSWGDQAEPAAEEDSVDVSVGIATPGASVSFSTFQDGLSPYGEWVSAGSYGQVWRPRGVPGDWRPYYYGRWEWTSEGWLWVSDEPFGWATYHYGRWNYDPTWGWVWVPGYQWAPAWVTWRYGPDYVGWAPLSPGFSVYVTTYPVVFSWWTFVPCGSFVGVPVHRYAYAPSYAPRIWGATRPAPPRAAAFGHPAPAWGGPARGFVEGRIGRPIPAVRVQPVSSPAAARAPGRAGVVTVFRPEARPAPAPRGWDRGGNRGAVEPARPAAPARGEPRTFPPPGRTAPPGQVAAPGRSRPSAPAYAPAPGQGRGPGYAPAQGQGQGRPAAPGYAPAPGQGRGPGYAPAPGYRGPAPQQAPRTQGPPARAAPPSAPRAAPQAPSAGHPAPARQGGGEGGREGDRGHR